MELVDPVKRAADEVVHDLATTEVENQRAPVRMLAFAGVFVLVERRSVEAAQPVLVAREMRRHPVYDDTDAGGVTAIDEVTEIVGIAEALSRRIHADRLVAPRTVERVLRYGEQLDVRETHVDDVVDQFISEFPVVQVAIVVVRATPPGTQVHFVDADGLLEPRPPGSLLHPLVVRPLVFTREND